MQLPDLKFWRGVLVAAFLAVISAFVATVPPFDHFGGVSLALIAGMLTKAFLWKRTSAPAVWRLPPKHCFESE
jgi:uncharacterized membrane protein YadS